MARVACRESSSIKQVTGIDATEFNMAKSHGTKKPKSYLSWLFSLLVCFFVCLLPVLVLNVSDAIKLGIGNDHDDENNVARGQRADAPNGAQDLLLWRVIKL